MYFIICGKNCNPINKALLTEVQEMQTSEFSSTVDLDEVAHYEPPHQGLQCLPSCL